MTSTAPSTRPEGLATPATSYDLDAHRFLRSARAQQRLHELIPGGAHTYARGADQYPEHMTPVLVRGRGARVWDVDGNEFVEYGMGLRSVILGHAYPPVVEAVRAVLADGVSFTRPTTLELAAAEDFLSVVPGADMVKFAKNGSDTTTAAVRLARAVTGRDMVAICRTQPFFSTDDWFVATTPMSRGIPDQVAALSVGFDYNDIGSVRALFERFPRRVACLVLEPATTLVEPASGFLADLRAACDREGCLLVFDEMITGFRWAASGAQSLYGVVPDLSTWGKAMGNGFPIAALAGKREFMELGGLRTTGPRPFLLSTTHGPESMSLAALRAVLADYRARDVVGVLDRQGKRLADGVNAAAADTGVEAAVGAIGRASCLVFQTRDGAGQPSQAYRTLFLQELLRHGVLGQSFVISAAHTDADVDHTVEAVRRALVVYRQALNAGGVDGLLHGRPTAPALRSHVHPREVTG